MEDFAILAKPQGSEMKVFSIMPHSLDPEFNAKKMLLVGISYGYNCEILIGSNSGMEDDINTTLEKLHSADAVLADLTLERPSCYFELGYAQAIKKPAFLIARAGTEIHQCISRCSLDTYSSLNEYSSLIRRILSSLSG
jgi:hypothetical protein